MIVGPSMKIIKYPHPALRFPAKVITTIDKEVRLLAGRMLELMYENKGLGLAAPQVAAPLHLLVLNFEGDSAHKDQECIAVNPVIIERKGTQEGSEGCLSFPDLYQNVRRAKQVTIRAYDLQGKQFEMTSTELAARLWQHEVDHLYGELFIDKMTPLGRLASKEALQTFEREFHNARKRGEIPSDAVIFKMMSEFKLEPATEPGPVL